MRKAARTETVTAERAPTAAMPPETRPRETIPPATAPEAEPPVESPAVAPAEGVKTRGPRRMRRRLPTRMAPPAVAVRGLWAAATEEERQRAHEAATAILGWWLAVLPKAEVLERLQVTPLRLWQMSQMAVSGMAAGLLKQPKRREKALPGAPAEESREGLKRKVAHLERDLRAARELVGLMRTLPSWRATSGPPGRTDARAHPRRGPESGRGDAAGRRQSGGAKGAGEGAREVPEDAPELATRPGGEVGPAAPA